MIESYMRNHLIVIVVALVMMFSIQLDAQERAATWTISPQFGWSDYHLPLILYPKEPPYYDHQRVLYAGLAVSYRRKLYKRANAVLSLGCSKSGMEGRQHLEVFTQDDIRYSRELWNYYRVYNLRLSVDLEYDFRYLILGLGVKYLRELAAYESQQAVWLCNYHNGNRFFERQAYEPYDVFTKNNFYSGIYLKRYLTKRLALSAVFNYAMHSITSLEVGHGTRPLEYYLSLNIDL